MSKQISSYEDFISVTPKAVLLCDKTTWEVVMEHSKIIAALKEKPMTVKELHDLFYDKENKKHKYTLKTIYRHIEKLENEGLVILAGHRVTEGAKIPERLYSRSAHVFFAKPYPNSKEKWLEYKGDYARNMAIAIGYALGVPEDKIDHEKFTDLFRELTTSEHQALVDIMGNVGNNEKLKQMYSNISIDKLNGMNSYASLLVVLLKKPELLNKLRSLFNLQ